MAPTLRESPFVGLMPFDEGDAPYFFGREKESRLIIADLFASPLTILYGTSGVGKSSLLRAGVFPRLGARRDILPVLCSDWQSDPMQALRDGVAKAAQKRFSAGVNERPKIDQVIRELQSEPLRAFLPRLAEALKCRIMIVLDQFEEFLLYHGPDEPLSVELPACVGGSGLAMSFMISLRDDAMSRLDRFEGRIAGLFDNLRRVDQLDAKAAGDAIAKPVTQFDKQHRELRMPNSIDSSLISVILRDIRAEGETNIGVRTSTRFEAPYLQLVMSRLWSEECDVGSRRLRLSTLDRLGGAQHILQTHLDEVMSRLSETDQQVAAQVFQLLVTPSASKIAHTVRDLADYAAVDRRQVAAVLNALSRGSGRILRPLPGPSGYATESRYEIFHDRLGPAILDWRTRFLAQHVITDVKANAWRAESIKASAADGAIGSTEEEGTDISLPSPPYGLLRDLLSAGRLALVLGMDAVRGAGRIEPSSGERSGYFPTSKEIARLLSRESGYAIGPAAPLAEAASYYANRFSRALLQKRLEQMFSLVDEYPKPYAFIARVAQQFPLQIITLAVDSLLEQVLGQHHVKFDLIATAPRVETVFVKKHDHSRTAVVPAMHVSSEKGVSTLYKLWGVSSSEAKGGEYLVTEQDQFAILARIGRGDIPPVDIRAALRDKPTLFVEIGARTWSDRALISTLRLAATRSERSWAILREPTELDALFWSAEGTQIFRGDLEALSRNNS